MSKAALKLVPPPLEMKPEGSSDETVDQKNIREYYELNEMYQEIKARRDAKYARISHLLMEGANVKQGKYKIRYGLYNYRRPKYKQVVIDLKGEAYQQRILNQTLPHASFRVRVQFAQEKEK